MAEPGGRLIDMLRGALTRRCKACIFAALLLLGVQTSSSTGDSVLSSRPAAAALRVAVGMMRGLSASIGPRPGADPSRPPVTLGLRN